MLAVMNSLQEEMKMLPPPKPLSYKTPEEAYTALMTRNMSIIDKTFMGVITTTLTCHKCEYQSHSYDPFLDILIEIRDPLL